MNNKERTQLKKLIDVKSRERAATMYMNCDPESLTSAAVEADELGLPDIARAFRNFRDMVVNPLLAEGWSLNRIEQAAYKHWTGKDA